MSHAERMMQKNFMTLLKEIPNGDNYKLTSNGKLVKKHNHHLSDAQAHNREPPDVQNG